MSGGSWNYAYSHVEELAARLTLSDDRDSCAELRRELGARLEVVAQALHDIEWVDSNDYAKGDEAPAIHAALKGGL